MSDSAKAVALTRRTLDFERMTLAVAEAQRVGLPPSERSEREDGGRIKAAAQKYNGTWVATNGH